MRVGASHKNPTRRWRYKNKTIVLFLMDSSIIMFAGDMRVGKHTSQLSSVRAKRVHADSCKLSHRKGIAFSMNYFPMVATRTALMECIRFSASSKTTLCLPRNTSSVTSRMSTPLSRQVLAMTVSKSWKEGRQCI